MMNVDPNFERQILNRMSALIDVIGPLTSHINRLADDIGRSDTEFTKLHRKFDALRNDLIELRSFVGKSDATMVQFRFDMTTRMDAIAARLEEIEATGDRNKTLTRSLASETILLHNAILNAQQESASNVLALKEFDERVAGIERRLGI